MHPKNSTAQQTVQLPKLTPFSFGPEYIAMFSIQEGADLVQGLAVAADLADGISQLCGRLRDSINDGETAYCAEIRALGFLGDAVSALTRSAQVSLKRTSEAGGDQ